MKRHTKEIVRDLQTHIQPCTPLGTVLLEAVERLEELTNIVGTAESMRRCQKEYFRTRNAISLQDSKDLERELDSRIKSITSLRLL